MFLGATGSQPYLVVAVLVVGGEWRGGADCGVFPGPPIWWPHSQGLEGGGGGGRHPISRGLGGGLVRVLWSCAPTTTAMSSCAPRTSPGRMCLRSHEESRSEGGFYLGRSSGLAFPNSMVSASSCAASEVYRSVRPAEIRALSGGGSRSAFGRIAKTLPRILVISVEVYVCLPGRPSPLAMMTMCAMVPSPQSKVNGPCFGEG